MHDGDFVYLDVRWAEPGWYEAMRFRLAGWLPEQLVATGVEKGVLEAHQQTNGQLVALTTQGISLTEPGPHSLTQENCQQLAEVLRMESDNDEWFQDLSEKSTSFPDGFGTNFRRLLIETLHRKKT
ncbi:hypothetical protein [Thioclava sp. IC9]|uniref:hypothetical protein n=1 Tax=Thioclava sp. IC9 TaxID=1973007 RepID=UPI000B543C48|nr:hypothetical protein [Thioclava sp. IC9]OWY06782.1 hypothetical protein B6V76_03065 [Thioclava sp. IC9]